MFEAKTIAGDSKPAFYDELAAQLAGLLAGERDAVANLANAAALIFTAVPHLNWSGFYLMRGGTLVLGPFQGSPACIRIAVGRGVCGTAVSERRTMRVADVHQFPGHIACDAASRSELVVPLIEGGRVRGVLDLDSPVTERFDADDQAGVERMSASIVAGCDWAFLD